MGAGVTRVAPEPTGTAVARVLAGGLPDTPATIARALAELLNRAAAADITVTSDEFGYRVRAADSIRWYDAAPVEYDTATGSWHATGDNP